MPKPTKAKVYAVPLAIAAVTFLGLSAALIGGRQWEPVSWVALGAPLVLIGLRLFTARRNGGDKAA